MLHVAFVRSDVARGTITALDVSAARELPGVVAVFTGADLNGDVGEAWVDFEGGDGGRPFRASPTATSASPASRSPWSSPSPLPRRGRLRPRRGRHRAARRRRRPRRRARDGGDPSSTPSATDNVAGAIPPADDPSSTRSSPRAAHVVTETFRPAPLPVRADGVPGRRVDLGPVPQRELVVHTSTQGPTACGFLARALGVPENRVRV